MCLLTHVLIALTTPNVSQLNVTLLLCLSLSAPTEDPFFRYNCFSLQTLDDVGLGGAQSAEISPIALRHATTREYITWECSTQVMYVVTPMRERVKSITDTNIKHQKLI